MITGAKPDETAAATSPVRLRKERRMLPQLSRSIVPMPILAVMMLLVAEPSRAELNFSSDKKVERQKREFYEYELILRRVTGSYRQINDYLKNCSAMNATSISNARTADGHVCASPDLHKGIRFDLDITRLLLLKQDYEKAVLDYELSRALVRLGEDSKETVLRKSIVMQEAERALQRELDSFKYYE